MKTEENSFIETPYVPTPSTTAPSDTAGRLKPMVYTPQDLEILLQLSKNTINALLNTGQLRAVRCGRKWLIPHDAVVVFLNPEVAS